MIAILSSISAISPTSPTTSIVPLVGVLAATAVKEWIEDYKRAKQDKAMNASITLKLHDAKWVEVSWRNIQVSQDSSKAPPAGGGSPPRRWATSSKR